VAVSTYHAVQIVLPHRVAARIEERTSLAPVRVTDPNLPVESVPHELGASTVGINESRGIPVGVVFHLGDDRLRRLRGGRAEHDVLGDVGGLPIERVVRAPPHAAQRVDLFDNVVAAVVEKAGDVAQVVGRRGHAVELVVRMDGREHVFADDQPGRRI
jgi:hypothetical protein